MRGNASRQVRIGGYLRVSTSNQSEKEHPIAVQEQLFRAWVEDRYEAGNYLARVYSDAGLSGGEGLADGSGKGRPGLTELVADILAGEVDVLWVQSIDRLTRDPETWSSVLVKALTESEVELWTSQGRVDPANLQDRLLANIMVALGEFERLQIGVKVKSGLRKRAEEGYPVTKVGFGWRWQPRDALQPNQRRGIEPVPEQQEHVVWMVDRYLEGAGAPAIARELNEGGLPGPTGGEWNVSSVRNTIFHPTHSGQVALPGEGRLVQGQHWEARLYDPEDYDRIMREKARRSRRRGTAPHSKFILSGTAVCGLCGRHLVGAQHDASSRRYQCSRGWTNGVPECPGVSCRADPLEEAVMEAFLEFADSPAIKGAAEEAALELVATRATKLTAAIRTARQTLADIGQRRDRWTDAYTAGDIDRQRFREYEAKLVEQQARAQNHLDSLRQQAEDQQAVAEQLRTVREALTDVAICWESLTFEQRRQMVHLAAEELTLEPEGNDVKVRLKVYFDEAREFVIPAASHRRVKPESGVDALTPTELAVLALLDEGLRPIEISRRRGVSRACTLTQRHTAKRKLGADSNEEAIELARERIAQTRRFLPTEPVDDLTELTSKPALTDDQRAVLELISQGLTYAQIGKRLEKSECNVKYFGRALFRKFAVDKREELVLRARHMGVVAPPDPSGPRDEGAAKEGD